jgi:hypothetical protein
MTCGGNAPAVRYEGILGVPYGIRTCRVLGVLGLVWECDFNKCDFKNCVLKIVFLKSPLFKSRTDVW